MNTKIEQQEKIKNWFDKTYKSRGEYYLRPVVAYEVFRKLVPYSRESKLLDIACGLGRFLTVFQGKVAELHGIDLSDIAVEKAKNNVPDARIVCGNAENLPYPDSSFDVISCIGSLERFLNLEKALNEQFRVAKTGAHFCFMVRNSKTLSWRIKSILGIRNKKGHQDAKTLSEWKNLFEKMGFSIINIVPDQWPVNRIFWWLSLRGILELPYKNLRSAFLPLEYVNEFIFILKKNE